MSNKKMCAGTYPVKEYDKKDGTHVSSYMRTCGAKHEGGGTVLHGGVSYKKALTDFEKKYAPQLQDSLTGEGMAKTQEVVAKVAPISSPILKYYQLSLDYENVSQNDKDNSYTTFGKVSDSDMRAFIKEKYKDCNITDSTPVVIVQPGTPLADSLVNSDLFNNAIEKQSEMIRNGDTSAKNFSLSFDSTDRRNLQLVLGKCNVYNLQPDNYCNTKTGAVVDYYDFTKLDHSSSFQGAFYNAVNNNAKIQQDEGRLTNYILVIPFVLFENDDI